MSLQEIQQQEFQGEAPDEATRRVDVDPNPEADVVVGEPVPATLPDSPNNNNNPHPASSTTAASSSSSSSVWEAGFHQWQQTQLAHKMSTWDEAYSLVIAYKESTVSEKHKFVSTAKDFVRDFNANPSRDVVETFLKFLKKYISGLFSRAEVAEDGFVAMYQTFAMVPDPSPLLLSAHVEWAEAQRAIAALHAQVTECTLRAEAWQRRHNQLEADLAGLRRELHGGEDDEQGAAKGGHSLNMKGESASVMMAPFSKELREVRSQLEDLHNEKQQLVQICHRMESEQALLLEQKKRLEEEVKTNHTAQLVALQKLEDRLSRAYRENSTLVDEVGEAHERLEQVESDLLIARAEAARQRELASSTAAAALTASDVQRDSELLLLLQDTTRQLQQRTQELAALRGEQETLQRRLREVQSSVSGGEVDDAVCALDGIPFSSTSKRTPATGSTAAALVAAATKEHQQQLERYESKQLQLMEEVRTERRLRRTLEGECAQHKTTIIDLERKMRQLEAAWRKPVKPQSTGPFGSSTTIGAEETHSVKDTWAGLEGLLQRPSPPTPLTTTTNDGVSKQVASNNNSAGSLIDESVFSLDGNPTVAMEGVGSGGPQQVLIVALQKQRDQLKQRLAERDSALQRAEAALADLRHEKGVLMVEKSVLERHIAEGSSNGASALSSSSAGGALTQGSTSPLDEPRQRAALLALKSSAASSSSTLSMQQESAKYGTVAVEVGAVDSRGATQQQQQGRRRRKVVQTLRSFGDQVAVLLANMLVYSPATRMALVFYIISLHAVVLLTTYTMAFRSASKYNKGC